MDNCQRPSRLQWIRSVLDRFEGQLIRFATRITGDDDRARDVVQETFLKLCHADRAEIEDHLAQWLFTVCRNQALDMRRKERHMFSGHMSTGNGSLQMIEATCEMDQPEPPAQIEHRETTSRVMRLLDALPEKQQVVIRLKFQNGLSYREIAGVTDLSVSNVGYLMHTGLKTIRSKINKQPILRPDPCKTR